MDDRELAKLLLIEYTLPNEWLIDILRDFYHFSISKAELTRILSGDTHGTRKSEAVLKASLEVLHSYEHWYQRFAKKKGLDL